MRKVALVFRTIGERTADIALELALQHIRPDKVHIIDNVRPFSEAVRQMLAIDYKTDSVVFMDADCLVLEDMRPFLDANTLPYVDCYVQDKFRGRVHMGVHITRTDVARAMQRVNPPERNVKYVLRPESKIRSIALGELGLNKEFIHFRILHDYGQFYRHIFAKCALRELRSRSTHHQARLEAAMRSWPDNDLDFLVARRAVEYARSAVGSEYTAADVAAFIAALPEIARQEVAQLQIQEKAPLTWPEVATLQSAYSGYLRGRGKVFGIGLSRTGTKSLTAALGVLDITVAHNPADEATFRELATGKYDLSLLRDGNFDGITDIVVAPFYAQLDKMYPNSKFILTVRDKADWLEAMERHWDGKPVLEDVPGQAAKLRMRRFLRAAVYGCYTFSRERLSYVYDVHYRNVTDYFRDRSESLLFLDICAGEGWEKLCPFLGRPVLDVPFPHVRKRSELSEADDDIR